MTKFDIIFSTEDNRRECTQCALRWLQKDFNEKKQPTHHFYHNINMIDEAFHDDRAMLVRNEKKQFVGFMIWSIYCKISVEIDIVEVDSIFRRQGVFTQMLEAFSKHFTRFYVLSAYVLPTILDKALPVLERMGWQRVNVTAGYISQPFRNNTFIKMLKNSLPECNYLSKKGIVIALCSQDFYEVQKKRHDYENETLYFILTMNQNGKLDQPIITQCHFEGYLGCYIDGQLIFESKVKNLGYNQRNIKDLVCCRSGLFLLNQLPSELFIIIQSYKESQCMAMEDKRIDKRVLSNIHDLINGDQKRTRREE